MLINAEKGFTTHDRSIIRYVIDKGKGLVIVINKWDLITKESNTMNKMTEMIHYEYPALKFYPKCYISIKENKRVFQPLKTAAQVYESLSLQLKTKDLNDFIRGVVAKKEPPFIKGKNLSIKYVTQVHHSPHVFAFFVNYPDLFPVNYKRFLENQFRNTFDFFGVPIKISFRKK